MDLVVLYGVAMAVGAAHTFEPDHMAAVGSFVVRRPNPRTALAYGLRWAMGHGGVILVVGTLLVTLRMHVPAGTEVWLERVVGASLVVLGGWVFLEARTLHAHTHRHADGTVHTHLHAHPGTDPEEGRGGGRPHDGPSHAGDAGHDHGGGREGAGHEHGLAATGMGALHGLAGTAPAVALLPMATFDSVLPAVGYLTAFGVGTAVSMGLYALTAGTLVTRAGRHSTAIGRALARVAGVGTVGVGIMWMLGA